MSDNKTTPQEPQGIPFFSIKTGETHWCKLEPTIAAYINSSDMGINASRDQDYGWRLAPGWVKKVRAFKRNSTQMSILTAKNGGQKPTTVQILYYMYGEELAAFYERQDELENPFEEEYQDAISGNDARNGSNKTTPQALADFKASEDEDDIADLIDDVMAEEDEPTPAEPEYPAPHDTSLTPEEQAEFDRLQAEEDAAKQENKPRATRSQRKQ